jgi:mannosylglucosylglycerate synthase
MAVRAEDKQALRQVAIVHYSAPPVAGGVEQVIEDHIRLLSRHNLQMVLVVGQGGEPAELAGARVRRIPELASDHPENLTFRSALRVGATPAGFISFRNRIASALEEAVRDVQVLVVHNALTMDLNLGLTAAIHQLLGEGRLPPCVAWTHDVMEAGPIQGMGARGSTRQRLLSTRRGDVTYVAVTHATQEALATVLGCSTDQIIVVPNGLDVGFWWNLRPESRALLSQLRLSDIDLLVLHPVRITAGKNISYSLRVIAELKRLGQRPRLIVTGPPDPHDAGARTILDALLAERKALGLESEVTFLWTSGRPEVGGLETPREVIRDLFHVCDAVILPSKAEGFGLQILEAGLLGRPVFCSNLSVFREVGGNDLRYFSLDTDPAIMAAEIRRVLSKDRGYRLRRRVLRRYDLESIVTQQMLPLFNALLEAKHGKEGSR